MSHHRNRSYRLALFTLSILAIFALLFIVRFLAFVAPNPVQAAWQLARKSGAYQFRADVVQYTDPVPNIRNTGRTSEKEEMHMQGQTNLHTRILDMKFWSQGGSLSTGQGQVEIQVRDGQAFARNMGEEWQKVNNFTGLFAPDSDFLLYLKNARNLKNTGHDTRSLPTGNTISYTRYTFTVNSMHLAQYMRDVLQQHAMQHGELPPGVTLKTPRMYQEMQGTGEVWIGDNGLPIRQILHVQFPEQNNEQIRAEITTDFSNFAEPPQFAVWQWHMNSGGVGQTIHQWMTTYGEPIVMGIIALVLGSTVIFLLIFRRRSRPMYATFTLFFSTILVLQPLLINLKIAHAAESRNAQIAERAQQRQEMEERASRQADALEPSIDPHTSPLIQAQEGEIVRSVQTYDENGNPRLTAIDATEWDHVLDDDGDGDTTDDDDGTNSDSDSLTDAQEDVLGTDSESEDTDSDGIDDDDEVEGFTYNNETWYTDPLNPDTNSDGVMDGQEWDTDLDSDGVPDVYDRDNDGDGVPDYLDDSPNQSTTGNTVTTMNYQVTGLDDSNRPTTVEFQVRPEDSSRIWYADNVLDWPSVDDEGNVQDADGATFADVDMLTSDSRNDYGDMTLVPMLEVRIQSSNSDDNTSGSVTSQLPYDTKVTIELDPVSSDDDEHWVYLAQDDSTTLSMTTADTETMPDGWEFSLVRSDCDTYTDDDTDTSEIEFIGDGASGTTFSGNLEDLQDTDSDSDGVNDSYAIVATENDDLQACGDVPALVFEGNNMIDYDQMREYNITVREDTNGDILAYVPVTVVEDTYTGEKVAFSGTMYYQPDTDSTWGDNQVGLIWGVQVLTDICESTDDAGACESYSEYNESNLVHTYADDWYLTGFSVREDYGSDLAIILDEDLESDEEPNNGNLLALAISLSQSFEYSADISIQDLYDELDSDVVATLTDEDGDTFDNPFQVETSSYTTLDELIAAAATSSDLEDSVTLEVLEQYFTSHASQYSGDTYYSLLFARSEVARTITMEDIDSYVTIDTSSGDLDLVADFSGATTSTDSSTVSTEQVEIHTVSMAHYEYLGEVASGASWAGVDIEDYLEWVEDNNRLDELLSSDYDALNIDYSEENQQGLLDLLLMAYATLYSGSSITVAIDGSAVYSEAGQNILSYAKYFSRLPGLAVGYAYFGVYASSFIQETVSYIFSTLKNLQLWQKGLIAGGVIVGIALIALAIAQMLGAFGDDDGWSIYAKVAIGVIVGAYVLVMNVIYPAYVVIQIVAQMAVSATLSTSLTFSQAAQKLGYLKGIQTAAKATIVMTVIVVVALIVAFIVAVLSEGIAYGSIAYDSLLAYTIASIIIAIVLAVIALIPVVGQIIAGIIALIDLIVWLITGSSATEKVATYLAEAFYSVNVMVEFDDSVFGDVDSDLVTDDDGYIDGNQIKITQEIASTVRHVDPDVNFNFAYLLVGGLWGAAIAVADYYSRLEAIESYYTQDNIRDVVMQYELSTSDEMDEVEEGSQEDDWDVTDNSEGYKYQASLSEEVEGTFTLEAGINYHPSFYLNYAYAVPTVGCWSFGADCDLEWTRDTANAGDYGEGLSYDVFPATVDEFLTLSSRDGGYYLGWDEGFDIIADADGDELLSSVLNGSDPDDTTWDLDGDGMSDLYELEQQEEGYYFDPSDSDSDDDMVPDADESWFGSNPANEDSDGDGLYDCEEMYHQLRSSEDREACDSFVNSRTGGERTGGGWLVFIGGDGSLQYSPAWSDPTEPDTDGDGLNDLSEYELREKGYHPQVENDNPLSINTMLLDSDGNEYDDSYVSPGTQLTLENIVSTSQTGSDSNTSWDNSLQVEFDDELGGDTRTWSLDLANDEEETVTYDFTIPGSTSDGTYEILSTMVARSISSASGDWVLSVADEETLTSGVGDDDEITQGIALAPIAGDTESYLYTTFTSDSDEPGGHGDVYAVKSGGSPQSVENDDSDVDYLRSGDTGPGVACNDSGTCFVAWADFDNCRTLNMDGIVVTEWSGDPNGGIEPYLLYKTYGSSSYSGWWYTGWSSNGSVYNLDACSYYPCRYTHGFPLSKNYCEQIDLKVVEIDGGCYDDSSSCDETDDELPGERSFGVFESDYNETEVTYNDNNSLKTDDLTCFLEEDDMVVCFETYLTDETYYNVAGALTNTSGSVSKSRFSIASSTDTTYNNHDYNPVVATDGENFLVIWERIFSSNSTSSWMYSRAFDESGSALDSQHFFAFVTSSSSGVSEQTLPPDSILQPQRRGYDVAWTGDYYVAVHHSIGTSDEDIYLTFLDSDGSLEDNHTLVSSDTTDELSTPRIASSPNNNRIAVVYEDNGSVYLLIGSVSGTSVTWDDEILVGVGSDPDIGYEAQSQSWVVAWTSTSQISSLLSNAGVAGRGQQGTTNTTSNASMPSGISELPMSQNEQVMSMLLMLLVLLILPALALSRNIVARRIAQSALIMGASLFIISCDTSVNYRNYQVYDLYGNSIGTASSADSVDSTDLALQCPDPDTAPLAQFSLEETADSPSFASDYGDATATCSGDSCPATGVVGEREMGGSTVQETWASFDGSSDYLEVEDIELDNHSFTVAFWARRNSSGSDQYVVSQGTNSTNDGLHVGFRNSDKFTCGFWGNDLNTSDTYTDNEWHHWTCTYNVSSGGRVIYLDGEKVTSNSSGISAYTGSGTLNIGRQVQTTSGYFDGDIDDVRIYQTALDSDAVAKIYSNALQNVCVAASHTGDSIVYTDIKMSETDSGESRIDLSNTIEVSVDATAPDVSFTSIDDGDTISIEEGYYKTISGSAYDEDSNSSSEEASGVATVEVSTDGGATWETATGQNSWSYNISLDTGTYTLQARATDEAGNTSSVASISITVDNDGPSVDLDTPDTSTQLQQSATDTDNVRLRLSLTDDLPGWRLPLAGTASDTASNITNIIFTLDGDGQKVATLHQNAVFDKMTSTDWYLDYLLNDDIREPNGEYVLEGEAEDSLTNIYTDTLATIRVDNTAPVADIVSTGFNTDYTDIITPVTAVSTFTGYVTDTGDVASGVRALEWALVSPEEVYFLQDIAPDRELDLSFDAGSPYEQIPWHAESYCVSDDTCPSSTSDGKVGNGMVFDGSNDYLEMSFDSASLEDGFTMAAWIYPTSDNSSGYHGFLGYQDSGTTQRAPGMWVYQGSRIHAGFGDGSTWNSLNTTTNVITLNEWNHVVSTFDGTTYRIYVNGEEVVISNSGTEGYDGYAGKTPLDLTALHVGRVNDYFAGTIDDALFYNRALNADEVAILASDGGRITDRPILDMSFDDEPVLSPVADMSAASYRNYCDGDECPTQTMDGIMGKALEFDGSDDELSLTPIDLKNKSFTVSFWARRSSTSGSDYVVSQGQRAKHKGLHIGFRDSNTFTCAFWGNDLNMDFTPDTSWHHWSCTYDASTNTRTIYMDGDAQVKSGAASADYQGSGHLTIGLRRVANRSDDGYFGGTLDEFALYGRALSSDEVLSLASKEPPGDPPFISLGFNMEANHAFCSDGACPAIIADGAFGEALHFDGSTKLTVPDNESLDLGHNFTIGMWVRPEQTSGSWQGLVAKPAQSANARNYGFFIKANSMQPVFFSSSASCDSSFSFGATSNLTEDAWNHLAATYDGSQFTLYVNGTPAGTYAHSGGICQNNYALMIGNDWPFYGDLDDVVIYERPLSEDEIADMASGIEVSDIPMLDLSFNATEPYALPAKDTSGEGNHAYCQGGQCPRFMLYGLNDESMAFDGEDDYLQVPDSIDLADSSFSVAFWARRDSSGTFDYIVSQGENSTDKGLHIGFRSNNKFTCAFYANDLDTNSTYTDNEWHHWACTYDVDTQERAIYRDGEQVDSIETGISGYEGNGELYIGSRYDAFGYFHGALDDVHIYNRALEATEVRALYRDADRTWYDAILGDQGATSSGWSLTIPEDIEAFYQLDTRGTDILGNRNANHLDWGTWRGEIDNKAPEVAISGLYNGTTIDYTCTATDFSLDEDSMECVDDTLSTTDTETYYEADWWDELTADTGDERLIGLSREVESDSVVGEVEVCDYYDHCSTAETNVTTETLAAIASSASVANLSADPPPMDPNLLKDNKLPPPPHPFIEASYLEPEFGSYYNTIKPISVTIVATTTKGTLETISLGANRTQFDFLNVSGVYGKPITNTVHHTSWTPTEDGFYKLGMEVRTNEGELYRSRPITVVVDTRPPQINIRTDKLTQLHQKHGPDPVLLQGDFKDRTRVRVVEVQVNTSEWMRAHILPKGRWDFPITRLLNVQFAEDALTGQRRITYPDNETFTINVRATDAVGNVGHATRQVIVDYAPPQSVNITMSYQNSQSEQVVLKPGDTVRMAPVELQMVWGESSDPGGIEGYQAGFTRHITPPLHLLTSYAPDVRQHTQTAQEQEVLYAHLSIRDTNGNGWLQTLGPIYVDAPQTPDLVDDSAVTEEGTEAAQLQQAPLPPDDVPPHEPPPVPLQGYTGWRQSGCSFVGFSEDRAEQARAGHPHTQQQRFYATWSEKGLRVTWEGANWNSDGDMFLYLNTQEGGSTQVYNPYPGVEVPILSYTAAVVPAIEETKTTYLPFIAIAQSNTSSSEQQTSPSVASTSQVEDTTPIIGTTRVTGTRIMTPSINLPFAADYMLWITDTMRSEWVTDTTHINLLVWDDSEGKWKPADDFTRDYVWYEMLGRRTNIYLPFSVLTIDDPQNTPLDMIALASESDVLHLWATMPDGNPLNSPDVTSQFVSPDLRYAEYTLERAYHWDTLGSGICPSGGQYGGLAVQLEITSDPMMAFYTLMGDGLYGLQEDLFAGADGKKTNPGFRGVQAKALPLGKEINYTIAYRNDGTETMQGVELHIKGHGVVRLPDGQQISDGAELYDNQILSLGNLAPGQRGEVTFRAYLDPSMSGSRARLDVELHDAVSLQRGDRPLEVYWTIITIDNTPPENVQVIGPIPPYVGVGPVRITGTVSDTSKIASITLEQQDASENVTTTTCSGNDIGVGKWGCTITLSGNDGDTIQVRAQAVDEHGLVSEWSTGKNFTIDQSPPEVLISRDDAQELVTNKTPPVRIGVRDNLAAAGVDVCRTTYRSWNDTTGERECFTINNTNNVAPFISLILPFNVADGMDGVGQEWLITGVDYVGNRSTKPVTATYLFDNVPPVITVNNHLQQVALADYQVITKTASLDVPPLLTGTATDGSRVANVTARLIRPSGDRLDRPVVLDAESGEWRLVTPLTQTGTYRIRMRAVDVAGNFRETKLYEVVVQ